MRLFKKISKIFEILEFSLKEDRVVWDDEALYESSVRKLGYRTIANAGARGNPVPNRPSLFILLTCLKMLLLIKTIMIWNCAAWKVFFMYRSLILAEYEHHVIMSLQFLSDSKFLWAGDFWDFLWKKSIFKRNLFYFWNFKIFEIFKILLLLQIINFPNNLFFFWKYENISNFRKFHFLWKLWNLM